MSDVIKQMADHLAKQRDKSSQICDELSTFCAYRGAEGTMCAVGCLIPDDLYNKDMERKSVSVLMSDEPVIEAYLKKLAGDDAAATLAAGQSYHDDGQYRLDILEYKDKTDEEFSTHIVGQIERLRDTYNEAGYFN